MTDANISSEEARDALDSVKVMQRSGFRRAVKPRWFGIGLALVVGFGFSLYVLEDPGNVPGLLICLAVVLFISIGQKETGASGRTFPGTIRAGLAMTVIIAFLLALFFGGIYVRRAYDLAWVPVVTGLIAGLTLFLISESERRYYLAKAGSGTRQ
jgi:hypothetical protein